MFAVGFELHLNVDRLIVWLGAAAKIESSSTEMLRIVSMLSVCTVLRVC